MKQFVLFLVVAAVLPVMLAKQVHGQIVHCDVLRVSDSSYAGRCTRNAATVALLVLRPPRVLTAGRWHGTTGARVFGERGDSTKDRIDWNTFSPAFVDVGARDGLFSWCWCVVTNANVDTDGLHFDADQKRTGPLSLADIKVVSRIRSYFNNSTQWNHHDDRSRAISYCQRNPKSRTLFCALYDATVFVRGEYYSQAPASRFLFEAIAAVSPREYQHPLTDFNNDPLVDFTMMTRMLDSAQRHAREAFTKSKR
jgi:hypothetical protein